MVALTLTNTSLTELVLSSPSSPNSSVHILALVLGLVALGLCLACMMFNYLLRNNRIIKMSSPRLNIVIACGGILASTCCGLLGMDYFFHIEPGNGEFICQTRTALLATAFTLIYGPMVGKTWRVNQIFRLAGAKRVIIKDFKLLSFTVIFLALDLVVLVAWYFGDPMKFYSQVHVAELYPSHPNTASTSDVTLVISCTSRWSLLWLLAFFLYKFPFLLFGLRESWWTRGLILPNLNDAYCIVVSSVTTVSMATIYFVTSVAFRNWPTVIHACAVVTLWLSTTVAICVVFLPKLLLWKRTPKGKMTRVSISSTNSSMAVLQSFEQMEAELTSANTEIGSLREFIKQKERDVEKLQNLLTNAENNLAQINFETDCDENPPTDLDLYQWNQSRLLETKAKREFCQEGADNRCQVTSCCLHGEPDSCLYLPSDKGYAPAYFPESNNSQHLKRGPRGTGVEYKNIRNKYIPQHTNPSTLRFPFQHHNSHRPNHQQTGHHRPYCHPYTDYSDVSDLRNRQTDLCYEKDGAVYESGLSHGDMADIEMEAQIAKVYNRVQKRRRSSTPSVQSTSSLSKLSKLRSDLNDAMTISNNLRSSWGKDLEVEEGKSRWKGRDKQRRKTVGGIRDITDSILESYDFQRTFDNHSFVSDCITPRSSEASYDMRKTHYGMTNNAKNNLRKIRRRRKQKNEPVTSISYARRDSFSKIPDTVENCSDSCGLAKADIQGRSAEVVKALNRQSLAAVYMDDITNGAISFIPARTVSVYSQKNQNVGTSGNTIAIITNDDLYPSEIGSRLQENTSPKDRVSFHEDVDKLNRQSSFERSSTTRFHRSQSDHELVRRGLYGNQYRWTSDKTEAHKTLKHQLSITESNIRKGPTQNKMSSSQDSHNILTSSQNQERRDTTPAESCISRKQVLSPEQVIVMDENSFKRQSKYNEDNSKTNSPLRDNVTQTKFTRLNQRRVMFDISPVITPREHTGQSIQSKTRSKSLDLKDITYKTDASLGENLEVWSENPLTGDFQKDITWKSPKQDLEFNTRTNSNSNQTGSGIEMNQVDLGRDLTLMQPNLDVVTDKDSQYVYKVQTSHGLRYMTGCMLDKPGTRLSLAGYSGTHFDSEESYA